MRIHFFHGDAAFDGTDEIAKIAADAFVFVHARNARERSGVRFVAVARR